MKPTDKIALITGASRGLGRNTAMNLARNGTDVILTYHSNQKEAESAVAEIVALGRKAVAFKLDTRQWTERALILSFKPRARREVFASCGSIHQ